MPEGPGVHREIRELRDMFGRPKSAETGDMTYTADQQKADDGPKKDGSPVFKDGSREFIWRNFCGKDEVRFHPSVLYPLYRGNLYYDKDRIIEPCCRSMDVEYIMHRVYTCPSGVCIKGDPIKVCPWCGAKPRQVALDWDLGEDEYLELKVYDRRR